MKEILRLKNISKTFPSVSISSEMQEELIHGKFGASFHGIIALIDMHFDLREGEIHAICGENGAGKSTLMKVITGVHKPEWGEIFINREKCVFKNPNDAFAKGISIIYQETSLFEEMTVLENIFLGHEKQKKILNFFPVLDYKKMKESMSGIFETLNTKIDYHTKIKDLGAAQKQMVEIAKALTFNSKILILDEPTASLTQREVDALFGVVRRLKEKGVAIAYISHRMEEIFELCDRVTVIRDGKFISCKEVKNTNKDEIVRDMVGRSIDNYYPKHEAEIKEDIFSVENLSIEDMLDNISFKIKKGEIVGFAGLAGSGRTELAQAICGLRKTNKGTIKFENKIINIKNYKDAKKNGIVYVSEDRGKYGLVVDMSIKHNITMPQLDKMSKAGLIDVKSEEELSSKYVKNVGIKTPGNDFTVSNLSGGNQQKVSISKALALNPKILILDEPTRGVDVNAKAEIHEIISGLAVSGLTIFMISSELPELLGMCDKIYVMKNGRIEGMFDRKENPSQEDILKIALSGSKN